MKARPVSYAPCPGSYAPAPQHVAAECPECGRFLQVVGSAVAAGWGRTRFPRHKAP